MRTQHILIQGLSIMQNKLCRQCGICESMGAQYCLMATEVLVLTHQLNTILGKLKDRHLHGIQ